MSYNDADYTDLALFLDEKYEKNLNRPSESTFVDATGRGRWTHDYIRERDKGFSHKQALKIVNERINEIVGLPPGTSPREDEPPPPGLVGKLQFENGWRDGNGYCIPVFCHFGEAFSLWTRNPDKVKQALEMIAKTGYDGIRTWITLNVNSDGSYWHGREVGPEVTRDYYGQLRDFILYCYNTHNLRLHLVPGDLYNYTNSQETALFENVGEVLKTVPNEAIALFEGLNEARDTGDDDDENPKEIERLVNIVRNKIPNSLYALSAYTGTEEPDTLHAWTPNWMKFFYVHGYRGGRIWDKVRHIFSLTYEDPVRSWGWQGEPCGPGKWVSVTANKEELTDESLLLMACMSACAGQVWCYMSSPGVIYDEPFSYMPGFSTVPKCKELLPKDISTFTDRFHAGERFADKRIFKVPGGDETRADHFFHKDGRFVVILYGPSWLRCQQVKPFKKLSDYTFGTYGRMIIGQME